MKLTKSKLKEIIREEIKKLSEEKMSNKEYQQLGKELAGEWKHQIIQTVKDTGYFDPQQMVIDSVVAMQYDPTYKGRVDADMLYDAVTKALKKQSWFKKLKIKI